MIIPVLTYAVIAVAGLLGSAIAWDDLRDANKSA